MKKEAAQVQLEKRQSEVDHTKNHLEEMQRLNEKQKKMEKEWGELIVQ